jgi:hypothetical protein
MLDRTVHDLIGWDEFPGNYYSYCQALVGRCTHFSSILYIYLYILRSQSETAQPPQPASSHVPHQSEDDGYLKYSTSPYLFV